MDKPGSFEGPLVRARNICRSYNGTGEQIQVLDGLEMTIDAGESVAIVGASGIGKSTLLHILGTLDRPDTGRLYYRDENVLEYDNGTLARFRNQCIGFIFQFHHLLPEFSALENVMMPVLIKGKRHREASAVSEAILVRMGLEDRLHHRANDLSGGEQQRVALARALVLKPWVLLADEPTGNLDRKTGDRVQQLLMELNRELSMTLVVVTHNLELAGSLSRQVTLVNGKLLDIDM